MFSDIIKRCNALKQLTIVFLLLVVFTACNSEAGERAVKTVEPKKEVDNGNENELNAILADFMQMNDRPYVCDTLLVIDKDSFIVSIKHLQIEGDSIVVPKKYVEMYKLESFSTSGFETSVTIKRNGKLIFKRSILKDDFQQYLDSSLKSYAVLLYPYIATKDGHIELHHSISIPLTDVGIGVTTMIDKNGAVEFRRN